MDVNLYAPLSPESIFGQWAIVNRVQGIWCLPWFLQVWPTAPTIAELVGVVPEPDANRPGDGLDKLATDWHLQCTTRPARRSVADCHACPARKPMYW